MADQIAFGIVSALITTIISTDGEEAVGLEVSYKRDPDPAESILFALYPKDAQNLAERLSQHAQSMMVPPTAH